MRAARITGATGSLLVHVFLILSLLHITGTAPAQIHRHTEWKEETADPTVKLRGADKGLVPQEKTPEGLAISGGDPCQDRSYIGIGVLVSVLDRVLMVGDNTPASRAGLRVGDVVMNPEEFQKSRDEGTVLRLRIERDGVVQVIVMAAQRICQD